MCADGKLEDLAGQMGKAIAKLHDGGLIHGDLTTSNMLLCAKTGQLVIIVHCLHFLQILFSRWSPSSLLILPYL